MVVLVDIFDLEDDGYIRIKGVKSGRFAIPLGHKCHFVGACFKRPFSQQIDYPAVAVGDAAAGIISHSTVTSAGTPANTGAVLSSTVITCTTESIF